MKNAFQVACATPWAIREEYLRTILAIANREHITITPVIDTEAVATELYPRLAGARTAMVANNNVAIIPVYGPIVRYASFFSDISGATSVHNIATDFRSALENPNIKAILLDIDSPGGQANGIGELSNIIYEARKNKKKKIYAYIGNEGASAAYWIAAAAEKIIAAPSAIIGSIGCVAVLPNPEAENSETVEFVSSQSPNKRPNINEEEGRSQVQTIIDDLAAVFISGVAQFRNVSTDTVIKKFGAGGVFVGQKSVDAGLADELGSFDSVLAELTDYAYSSSDKQSVKAEGNDMDLRAKLESLLATADEEKVEVSDTAVQSVNPAAENVVPVTATSAPVNITTTAPPVNNDEVARLKAENLQLRKDRYNAEADTFITTALAEGRAFPSEQQILKEVYIQACIDDFNANVEKSDGSSRVGMLGRMIASRPANQLSGEAVAQRFAQVLNVQTKPTSSDDEPMTADEQERYLNMTPLGKEVLSAMRNGSK